MSKTVLSYQKTTQGWSTPISYGEKKVEKGQLIQRFLTGWNFIAIFPDKDKIAKFLI